MQITPKTATVLMLAAVAVSFGGIAASNATSATTNSESRSSIGGSLEAPIHIQDNEITKNFLIGYPLAIQIETANRVNVNDYPWLSKIVRNGEAIVSYQELIEFVDKYNKNPDFAILLESGETKYYNINWYRNNLIPNTPYVKAYWEGELPTDVTSKRANLTEIPALREAIEDKSRWVPLDNQGKVSAVKQLLENTNSRHFEVILENGVVEPYHIRYINASQTEITG